MSRRCSICVSLFCLLALALLGLATSAWATDGVLEINHACAVGSGCFSGDAAGYPVTIDGSAGRSYRLTSDLVVPDQNTDGIVVATSSVSIDLNGFEIARSACVGATSACTPASGTGSGVERVSAAHRGISVRNGSITGMGQYGALLGDQAEVMNLRLRWNRLSGTLVGIGSTITGSTGYENGAYGIATGAASTISGSTAYDNGVDGISAGAGSTVSGSTAYQNGSNGITASTACALSGNTVYQNGGSGISAAVASTVSGNTAFDNDIDGISAGTGSTVRGNTAYQNGDDGIQAFTGSTVHRNTVRSNSGYGLELGSGASYRENTISSNTAGTVSGGLDLGHNACNGSTCL